MRKLAILLPILPNMALACGGSSGPSYSELALFFVLFLIGLAAFILPISILSLHKLCSGKGILLLFTAVLVLSVIAVILIIYWQLSKSVKGSWYRITWLQLVSTLFFFSISNNP